MGKKPNIENSRFSNKGEETTFLFMLLFDDLCREKVLITVLSFFPTESLHIIVVKRKRNVLGIALIGSN